MTSLHAANESLKVNATWEHDPTACTPDHASASQFWRQCSPTLFRWAGEVDGQARAARCDSLFAAGVHRVLFIGDSFARHTYVAFVLALSNNYVDGALVDGAGRENPECRLHGQFSSKACRKLIATSVRVCNSELTVSYSGEEMRPNDHYVHCMRLNSYACLQDNKTNPEGNVQPVPTDAHWREFDRIVWGVGRHRVRPNSLQRFAGISKNDAAALQRHVVWSMCQPANGTSLAAAKERRSLVARKLVWLDTLYRTAPPKSSDECLPLMLNFHLDMPRVLKSSCGATRVASMWDATTTLAATPGSGWQNMTFDGVHWGMAINLLLANEVARQMLTGGVE